MSDPRICYVDGCGKSARKRDMCDVHYQRWRRHGDPVVRVRISKGEPLRFLNEVILKYDGNDCLSWPFAKDEVGRGRIWRDGKMKNIHRIICETVNGPSPTSKHEAAHKCGNGHIACCTPNHMSWKTHKENDDDKDIHRTRIQGEISWNAKLTDTDIPPIRFMFATMRDSDIASKFGVHRRTITDIRLNKTWRHIT